MNLVDGQILEKQEANRALDTLEARILKTLQAPRPSVDMVIAACDRLVFTLDLDKYLSILESIGISNKLGRIYIEQAKTVFSAGYLKARLERELGAGYEQEKHFVPAYSDTAVSEHLEPLGVLLHIAAGNADGLPAFSVLEGLLTGNINILKLPEVDGGISVLLLQELIRAEPTLAEYIYVFDYSSKDVDSIQKLVVAADAIVVWGGDIAVRALRNMAPPNVKLIEWGHKSSFAYVTSEGLDSTLLEGLARHICETNQLLCSSCQGIFVDTDDMADVHKFCEIFLPILEHARAKYGSAPEIGAQAQVTLQLYSQSLEAMHNNNRIFTGKGCSLIASPDNSLEPSLQFCNCWVKPLPRDLILPVLRPHKSHLQTVSLLCDEAEFAALSPLFLRAGIVRITDGENMSSTYCGAAHDGEYPLRRYTKMVSLERGS